MYAFLFTHVEELDLQFQARRCTWRSWAFLNLLSWCSMLRLGLVKTHSDVNSWPSRSPSSEYPLLPCLRAHFLRIVERAMEMPYYTWSLESTYFYSSLNKKNTLLCTFPLLSYKEGGRMLGVRRVAISSSPWGRDKIYVEGNFRKKRKNSNVKASIS